MTTLSKYYSDILISNKVSCAHVLHPTTSCSRFLLKHIPLTIIGTGEFFFPLYFIPLLANPRNITKEKFIDVCKVYINSVQTATCTVMTVFLMICVFSNCFGCTSFWTLIPIPSLIGSWSFYFSSDKVRSLFGHATSVVNMEMLIRDGTILPFKLIQRSSLLRTLMFMGLSGIILDSLYMDSGSAFWLFHPIKKRTMNDNDVVQIITPNTLCEKFDLTKETDSCLHSNSCAAHNKQVLRNYLLLGIALEAAKSIFSNFTLIYKKPKIGFLHAIKHVNVNLLAFICGYPTLTNLMNCLLNRYNNKSSRFNQAISAMVGGLPFYFASNEMSIFSHTISTAAESLWYRYKKFSKTSTSKMNQHVARIPFAILILIFGGTFMYTARLFFPWMAPKFLHRLLDLLTSRNFDGIGERVHSIWIPETIV